MSWLILAEESEFRAEESEFRKEGVYCGMAIVLDSIGWIGSVMVVLAYALNMYKRMASDSIGYYTLNILGSACLVVNTIYHHAIPSAVVNIIWVFIALIAIARKK